LFLAWSESSKSSATGTFRGNSQSQYHHDIPRTPFWRHLSVWHQKGKNKDQFQRLFTEISGDGLEARPHLVGWQLSCCGTSHIATRVNRASNNRRGPRNALTRVKSNIPIHDVGRTLRYNSI
ncbi:unnamed protein product, partial [Ectocarpus sp. 12 AP-2014]